MTSQNESTTGNLVRPRFYWATFLAMTVIVFAAIVLLLDFETDPNDGDKLSETELANLRATMIVVIIAAVVAWAGYVFMLWRRPPKACEAPDDHLFTQLWEECAGMAAYALERGIPIEGADARRIHRLRAEAMVSTQPGADIDRDGLVRRRECEIAGLTETHRRLAKAVAPAKPLTLRLLHLHGPDDRSECSKPMFDGLGRVRLVRRMVALVAVLIPMFLLLAVSVGTRLDDNRGALFDGNPIEKFESVIYLLTASALGAAFAALFKAFRYIENLSYDPRWESSYWVRFILGVVAGLILSTIVVQAFFDGGGAEPEEGSSAFRITVPLLALVGGFSSDVVYRILKRVIDAIEALVRGSASERVELQAERSAAATERLLLADRKELASEIMSLRSELADEPSAVAALDGTLRRILNEPPPAPTFEVVPLPDEERIVPPGERVDLDLVVEENRAPDVVAAVLPPERGTIARRGRPTAGGWTFTASQSHLGPVTVLFAIPDTDDLTTVELTVGSDDTDVDQQSDAAAGVDTDVDRPAEPLASSS